MLDSERMIRHCARSQSGWNNGDLAVVFQLFSCGMVWDGNLVSKSSRDHLVRTGHAVRAESNGPSIRRLRPLANGHHPTEQMDTQPRGTTCTSVPRDTERPL
jgi:hypothetical protein